VLARIRARFGGRLRFFVSGSAPLPAEVADFFAAIGVVVLEGYGLTESAAASFVNRPGAHRSGTVGLPLPGTEVRLAPDGEILLHGRGIMRGYHGLPAETRAALGDDGWLRTGDVGRLRPDGFLEITDRKKDLIKTSTGKYVAPQLLEGLLETRCAVVSHALVHGDGRSFVTALVTLEPGYARDDPRVRAEIQRCVDEINAGRGRHEAIRGFTILERDFTIEDGELTPNLKVRRKVVEATYRGALDAMYR
jgi:long-chain acyl-CoA synthetase